MRKSKALAVIRSRVRSNRGGMDWHHITKDEANMLKELVSVIEAPVHESLASVNKAHGEVSATVIEEAKDNLDAFKFDSPLAELTAEQMDNFNYVDYKNDINGITLDSSGQYAKNKMEEGRIAENINNSIGVIEIITETSTLDPQELNTDKMLDMDIEAEVAQQNAAQAALTAKPVGKLNRLISGIKNGITGIKESLINKKPKVTEPVENANAKFVSTKSAGTEQANEDSITKKPSFIKKKLTKVAACIMLMFSLSSFFKPANELNASYDIKAPIAPSTYEGLDPEKEKEQLEMFERMYGIYLKLNPKIAPISEEDRDIIAKMVIGEAGKGADPFEVLHVLFNRLSSDEYQGSAKDLVLAPAQFDGYKPTFTVTPEIRAIVDMVIEEYEDNGRLRFCDTHFFLTGEKGVNNVFEVSRDPENVKWLENYDERLYRKPGEYCRTATEQYERFLVEQEIAEQAKSVAHAR